MLSNNLKNAFERAGLVVKEVAAKAGVSKGTIDNWVNKGKEPKAVALYAVCKAVDITIEQALDGEAGADYVRDWARRDGNVWQPPEEIADLVDGLKLLTFDELVPIRGAIQALVDGKKAEVKRG